MLENVVLDREEYIEQAYFFRVLRERMVSQFATQEILDRVHEEILATTRLPLAIQFLATELKHTGLLSSGFARLAHYFTPFQAFVIRQSEEGRQRLSAETAFLILEREATYRADKPTTQGLFVYQFEAISRNRLGYDDGLECMAADSFYDWPWREYLDMVRRKVGAVDFPELIYVRSALYVSEQRRNDPDYEPPVTPLFGEKEGKIARASIGRDPLYLFAALQRQLGYPEVPRPKPKDDLNAKLDAMQVRFRVLEARIKLVEGELRGQLDISQLGQPELLKDAPEEEI